MQEENWQAGSGAGDFKGAPVAEQREELGVYAISVVAQLVGTGQQNIRLYERRGLLTPDRTAGGTRQYSDSDLAVLRRIGELLEEGLNLAGVAKVLELEAVNARLQGELSRLKSRRT
jgi:DNA-binding transcriptional MerR regulator